MTIIQYGRTIRYWGKYLLPAAFAYILLSSYINLSDQNNKETQKAAAQVQGTITNPIQPYVVLEKIVNTLSKTDTAVLDENGGFKFTTGELEDVNNFRLHFGAKKQGEPASKVVWLDMLLYKGSDLNISLDANNAPASFVVTGKGEELYRYYAAKININRDFNRPYTRMADTTATAFIAYLDGYEKKSLNTISTILEGNGITPAEYVSKEKNVLKYNLARMKCFYAARQINKQKTDSVINQFNEGYFSFLKEISFKDETLAESGAHKLFISNYTDYLIAKKYKGVNPPQDEQMTEKYKTQQNLFASQALKDAMGYDFLNRNNANPKAPWYGRCVEDFNKTAKSDSLKSELNNNTAIRLKLGKGEPAMEFSYTDKSGKTVKLSDLKGRYVYIDVWATWCGPCLAELPFLEKLQDDYKDKKIAFVSISIDKEQEKWQKFVEKKQMKGIQLWAGDKKETVLLKDYLVLGIPRCILIDPAGNFIDGNAPRPSSPELMMIMRNFRDL